MECVDLDALYARAGHACEICRRVEGRDTGVLNIDHEGFLGWFAVRGLLCGPCNGWIEWPSYWPEQAEAVDRYLANPWWARSGGPRPLGRALFSYGRDRQMHIVGGSGIRRIGFRAHSARCGQEMPITDGVQLYEVDDSHLCHQCIASSPIEMERLEYYRNHPCAFAA